MPQTSAIGAVGDGSGNQYPRMPSNKRNWAMEKISRNCLRLRGRSTAATGPWGRNHALEALCTRLGVIPVILWPTATAGTGNLHALAPSSGAVTVAQADASTPATNAFNKGDPSVAHAFTAAGVKQTVTATFAGNANAKGRAAEII